jgi:hypothetical protein
MAFTVCAPKNRNKTADGYVRLCAADMRVRAASRECARDAARLRGEACRADIAVVTRVAQG